MVGLPFKIELILEMKECGKSLCTFAHRTTSTRPVACAEVAVEAWQEPEEDEGRSTEGTS